MGIFLAVVHINRGITWEDLHCLLKPILNTAVKSDSGSVGWGGGFSCGCEAKITSIHLGGKKADECLSRKGKFELLISHIQRGNQI